jgi:hypothetical protein
MRFSDLSKIFRNAYSEYSTLANGVRLYQLTAPVTPNVTTTTAPNGSWGITSHATGLGILFVSDGAFWQSAKGYLSYVALVGQATTDAPVMTALVNELGSDVTWTRSGAGLYITAETLFPQGRTVVQFHRGKWNANTDGIFVAVYVEDHNKLEMRCEDITGSLADLLTAQGYLTVWVFPE